MKTRIFLSLFLLIVFNAFAEMRGNEFTYQGTLNLSGVPANDSFDFEFGLFNSQEDGTLIGTPVLLENVVVIEGRFIVELDFGSAIVTDEQLWLQIGVKAPEGLIFTVLTPRQKLTAAPFASVAGSVLADAISGSEIADGTIGSADIADGSISTSDMAGNSITSGELADTAVDTAAIQDNAVTAAKLAANSVGSDEIQDGSVQSVDVDSTEIQLRISGTCATGSYLAGINGDGSLICNLLPIGLVTMLDATGDVGVNPSMAIRANGLAIISYYDQSNRDLKLIDCSNTGCTSGTKRTLVNTDFVGLYNDVAIRNDGRPIISYYDQTNGNLDVYDCDDAGCTTGTARNLKSTDDVGRYNQIAIRQDGSPIVTYYNATADDFHAIDCNNADCSSATNRPLDNEGFGTGLPNSIAIRQSGLPIISYADNIFGEFLPFAVLKVFDCGDTDCSTGTVHTLDSGTEYEPTSTIIRDSGLPLIGFAANSSARVYDCENTSCSSGSIRVVSSTGDVANGVSMAMRSNGLPVMSFYDKNLNSLIFLGCGNDSCTDNGEQILVQIGVPTGAPSVGLRSDGLPFITYRDFRNEDLKIYNCADTGCEN